MVQRICNHLALLVVGACVGAVLTSAWLGFGRGVTVQATATDGVDNFAIATGFVDDGVEALYFLDFLTGDLSAVVISRRNGNFDARYEYNVQADFGATTQNPKYLMVTGIAALPRGRRNTQLGKSLIYIAEATSGQVYAYALPWNSTASAAGQLQSGSFILMGGGSIRSTFVRDAD